MVAQQFQDVQGLRALANDATDVLAGGQMIRNSDAKHLYGAHTTNVRYLWRQTLHLEFVKTISVDLAMLSLRLLFCAHRST